MDLRLETSNIAAKNEEKNVLEIEHHYHHWDNRSCRLQRCESIDVYAYDFILKQGKSNVF